ncbi:LysE family translocator [Tropicimonas isoalkanivorans]|uniref:Threonine/homoserine/homoserine lactone efflux protein n=1 Tax=Tropicimonas isoalkanivorans TaxID=441112 RepID=A0A1I1PYR4_9RHOB|nr:LysE family translocator [Tropicimonas isoalkanivorans]SFD14959.1 Threonine/homoserine/homoserine lactone efflux protein [Tropicimonas isoalkanivorans]
MVFGLMSAFWAVSVFFVITPGVDWAYAISAGLGKRAVLPAVSGLLLGHLAATLLVATGVGALIAGVPFALPATTALGSAYLLWLGGQLFLARPEPFSGTTPTEADRDWKGWLLKGFCVSGLNPKVFLLFLTLLPQFTTAMAPWPVPVQIVALGVVHLLNCAVVYFSVGFFSTSVLRARPDVARTVNRVSGAIISALGLILLWEAIF